MGRRGGRDHCAQVLPVLVLERGDFLYIPAGVRHLPVNLSDTEPLVGIIARTDPEEQESVVLLPDLDELPHLA